MIITSIQIAERAAAIAGVSREKGVETVQIMIDRMIKHFVAGEPVEIDGFGTFRMGMRKLFKKKDCRRYQFYPAQELIDAVNSEPVTGPIVTRPVIPENFGKYNIPQGRGTLPVHPIREEDSELLDRWYLTRRGVIPEAVTASVIYKADNMPPAKIWSEITAYNARKTLRAFARRVQVPLRQVGLQGNGVFTNQSLRDEIITYAQDYEARSVPRLEYYLKMLDPVEQQKKGPLVWRMPAWQDFVDAGTEFYNWLERQNLRPAGSNPFRDIRKLPPLDFLKGRTIIIEKWYERIMAYPRLTPKQRCILHLLSNGLRVHEVASARIERLHLRKGMIEVIGKGGKHRRVWLFQAAVNALDKYLVSRATVASPWLFPRVQTRRRPYPGVTGGRFEHLTPSAIGDMVQTIVRKVFPKDEDAEIWSRISPHKFRHYYVSSSLHKGMDREVLMEQVGHGAAALIDRYKSFDPAWVEAEVRRIDRKRNT